MSIAGKCIKTCTTPQHGYVDRGRYVDFDLPEWDDKAFPYLKHFNQVARAIKPQLSVDEGETAARLKAAGKFEKSQPLGVAPSEAVAQSSEKRLEAMGPEELDDVTVGMLVARAAKHGVELDADSDRTDLIVAAMEAEEASKPTEEDLFE